MPFSNVGAVVADFEAALTWYARLFGRSADQHPMVRLAEWDLTSNGGVQVFQVADKAGHTSATLIVDDLEAQAMELRDQGFDAGEITIGTAARFVAITDPDGNTITFAAVMPSQPRIPPKMSGSVRHQKRTSRTRSNRWHEGPRA